jgi:choice-of-anchor B domain-containing protein
MALNPKSGFAYLCGSNLAGGGLVPVDLSEPRKPKILVDQAWSNDYVHNVVVKSYAKGPRAGREIAFASVPSVVGNFNQSRTQEGGVAILDVTDKDNIFEIKRVHYPNELHSHSAALNGKGNFLYVNDEADEWAFPEITTTQTYILRVRKLEKAAYVRTYSNGLTHPEHDTYIRKKLLYYASYGAGLRIASIRDPKFPKEIAYFDTYPETEFGIDFHGAWGAFVFPSMTIVISDQQRGLFVLQHQP